MGIVNRYSDVPENLVILSITEFSYFQNEINLNIYYLKLNNNLRTNFLLL